MALNRKGVMDEWTADKWYREFFTKCCLPEDDREGYAVLFAQNGMRLDMLPLLNKDWLKEMKIHKVGHIIEILRAAQMISSQEQRLGIAHSKEVPGPSPQAQSKVVSLKSVVNKDRFTRKESEVGGVKRAVSGVKRSLPVEEPTLSVKMPARLSLPTTSRQSVERVDESPEKKKRSVFERLGTPSKLLETENPGSGGILKSSNGGMKNIFSKSTLPVENKKQNPPARLSQISNPPVRGDKRSASPYARRSITPPKISNTPAARPQSPAKSQQASVEPSFHVTMSMKLSNPLVTKVNKPQSKKPVSRNAPPSLSRSSITPDREHYYGSMAADQVAMSSQGPKQRLGQRYTWTSSNAEKKKVSFGNVRTKEIPAVAGTVPLSASPSIISKQLYVGSIALRTAKRL